MSTETKFTQGVLNGFQRYDFAADGSVINHATQAPMKLEQSGDRFYYRLTNDAGERKQINQTDIVAAFNGTEVIEAAPVAAAEVKKEVKAPVATSDKPAKRGKLSEDQVREIRSKKAAGTSAKELSAEYGVHSSTISEIISRKLYPNVV